MTVEQGVEMDSHKETRSYPDGTELTSRVTSGVGARYEADPTPERGGGYQDVCTAFELSEKNPRDPRMDELSRMGIAAKWRSLAARIGFDAFIVVWSHLSEQAENADDGHRVYVPKFDMFMRYQRNRFILSLHQQGFKPREIRRMVIEEIGEAVHVMHICRIIRQSQSE